MTDDTTQDVLLYDASDEYRPEPPPPPEIPAWKSGGIRIGIHTSIAGDIVRSLDLAATLGANALQIFSSSPRMWASGSARISEVDAARFRQRRKELGLGPVVIHGNYLITWPRQIQFCEPARFRGFIGRSSGPSLWARIIWSPTRALAARIAIRSLVSRPSRRV